MPVIHHDRDGRPRCGRGKASGVTPLTVDPEAVTCKGCLRRMDVQPCGTWSAYKRHRTRGEEPCEACMKAMRAYGRDLHRRQTGREGRGPVELAPCGTPSARKRHRKHGEDCDICAPRQPDPCGTPGAYKRHRRHGEEPCGACREAMRAYWRVSQHPQALKPCGTYAAWWRHYRAGEEPCEACAQAKRDAYKAHPRPLRPCGTYAAWLRHARRGETPCGPCAEAKRARDRTRAALLRHKNRRRAVRRYLATEAQARSAALWITDRAADADEARELLRMLGLLERPLRIDPGHPHGPLMYWNPTAMEAA